MEPEEDNESCGWIDCWKDEPKSMNAAVDLARLSLARHGHYSLAVMTITEATAKKFRLID